MARKAAKPKAAGRKSAPRESARKSAPRAAARKSVKRKAPRRQAGAGLCAVTGLPNSPAWFRRQAARKKGKKLDGRWRTLVNVWKARLKPYDLQGTKQTDLTWCNISYDEKTGRGVFLIRFAPGAVSIPHEHRGFEEFLILEGTSIDADGALYGPGDFVSLKPGSKHYNYTETGTYSLVILRGGKPSRTLEAGEKVNVG